MFEGFTEEARQVVVRAQAEAEALHHGWIGTEHLLLGVSGGESDAARVLESLGLTRAELLAAVRKEIGEGGPDVDALASIGIDLEEVRRKVEAAFGPGALERTRAGRRRGFCAQRPFTRRSKKALELALRESGRLRHGWIGPEHVLLGLLAVKEGLAVELVEASGHPAEQVREAVLARLGRAA